MQPGSEALGSFHRIPQLHGVHGTLARIEEYFQHGFACAICTANAALLIFNQLEVCVMLPFPFLRVRQIPIPQMAHGQRNGGIDGRDPTFVLEIVLCDALGDFSLGWLQIDHIIEAPGTEQRLWNTGSRIRGGDHKHVSILHIINAALQGSPLRAVGGGRIRIEVDIFPFLWK